MGTTKLSCDYRGLHIRGCPSTSLPKPLLQPAGRTALWVESMGWLDARVVPPFPTPRLARNDIVVVVCVHDPAQLQELEIVQAEYALHLHLSIDQGGKPQAEQDDD